MEGEQLTPGSQRIWADGLFEGKTVIVTGGGTGIGYATAKRLGELGANLVIGARNEERILDAAERLRKETGAEVEAVRTNIRVYEEVERIYQLAEDRFGHCDIVVNNAGGQFVARFEDISVNGFRAVVETNLMGTFHSCKVAAQHMKRHGGGKIINIVNDFVFERGAPEFAHSGAARAGVVNLTYTLALELAPYGITANVISPGIVGSDAIDEYYGDHKVEGWLDRARADLPLKRFCEPEEVADMILFVASPGGDYLSGSCIRFDGGEYVANFTYAWPERIAEGTPVEAG
jgi:NAD(P)-dependent dehydrogenase (short-subunit alcohol dehydrogenase family)